MPNNAAGAPQYKKWVYVALIIAAIAFGIYKFTDSGFDITCATDKNAQEYGLSSHHPECK